MFGLQDVGAIFDTDNDSFGDEIENQLGSDPNNSENIPTNLIAYFDFENDIDNKVIDKSPWKNHGTITTPDLIKLGDSQGAPKGASPKTAGTFNDGMIDVPGIKMRDLLSGVFGINPEWNKIGTFKVNLPYARGSSFEKKVPKRPF